MNNTASKAKLYIDGEHGTTGLQIRERLALRFDIDVLSMPHEERRNADYRAKLLNEADIAILCLPDDASREAVQMLESANNTTTRLIDASSAFRTNENWAYGFAELEKGNREKIASARFVTNPGCYATGAIALLRPLILAGLLPADYPLTINAVSGYSGGGKNMIAQMEDATREDHISSAHFLYALPLAHKHMPEIVARSGLKRDPVFTPNVGRFAQGMLVNIPLHLDLLKDASIATLHEVYETHYTGQNSVSVASLDEVSKAGSLDPEEMRGTDNLKLYVTGAQNSGRANLVASLDNLGKGASGAAVQNMDIMLKG
ncbi:MAG: N-acetyl-gamma-glutamyl-phosphate reductase [Rhizobiales bacterium]|nr:N-acetyl-gamma-glutamyl-phosphate reductase [Hyphomicrobiales bacterium]